jgi:hypothetical protein
MIHQWHIGIIGVESVMPETEVLSTIIRYNKQNETYL